MQKVYTVYKQTNYGECELLVSIHTTEEGAQKEVDRLMKPYKTDPKTNLTKGVYCPVTGQYCPIYYYWREQEVKE